MIRYMIGPVLLILPALAVGALAQNSPPGGQQMAHSTALSIEAKAALANADDPNSIRALRDELFNLPRAVPRMPTIVESMVKDRLVQSEILYRQGKTTGVQEQDIVDTFNGLADKLGGPPYSKTTPSQVRILRMRMALSQPKFMGAGVSRQDIGIGGSVNPAMGPLQATHLITTLMEQKLTNPDFRVTPQEWESSSLQKVKDKMEAAQARVAAAKASGQSRTATLTARTVSSELKFHIGGVFRVT